MNNHDLAVAFGVNLRAARKGAGLSQSELARLAGVRPPFVCQVESGKTSARRGVSMATLYALAAALNVPPADLLPEAPANNPVMQHPPKEPTDDPRPEAPVEA